MHQQSDRDNPAACASHAMAEDARDDALHHSAERFSDMSLPDLLDCYIGDGLGDDESVGALGESLANRVLGTGQQHVAPGSGWFPHDASQAEAAPAGPTFAGFLASFPVAVAGRHSSVAAAVASCSRSGQAANNPAADPATYTVANRDAVVARGNVCMTIGPEVARLGVPHDGFETQDNVGKRLARLIRIVASVASREVTPDASHRPVLGEIEYDARGLLVAAYARLTKGGGAPGYKPYFAMSKFSRLAGAIQGKRFIVWTHQFKGRLDDAEAFWARLGLDGRRNADVTIAQLKALTQENAPALTLQDLKGSPFYRKLSLTMQSSVSAVQLSKANRASSGKASTAGAAGNGAASTRFLRDAGGAHGLSLPAALFDEMTWSQMPLSFDALGAADSLGTTPPHFLPAPMSDAVVPTALGLRSLPCAIDRSETPLVRSEALLALRSSMVTPPLRESSALCREAPTRP